MISMMSQRERDERSASICHFIVYLLTVIVCRCTLRVLLCHLFDKFNRPTNWFISIAQRSDFLFESDKHAGNSISTIRFLIYLLYFWLNYKLESAITAPLVLAMLLDMDVALPLLPYTFLTSFVFPICAQISYKWTHHNKGWRWVTRSSTGSEIAIDKTLQHTHTHTHTHALTLRASFKRDLLLF